MDFDDLEQEAANPSLSEELDSALARSAFDNVYFLPEGLVDELLNKENVRAELGCPSDKRKVEETALSFIFGEDENANGDRAKKLFVIALMAGIPADNLKLARVMGRFLNANIRDGSLPIKDTVGNSAFYDPKGSLLAPWSGIMIRNFIEKQWTVIAPVFTDQNLRHKLDEGCVLPIVEKVGGLEEGAFGEVMQVAIHERHNLNPILKHDGTRAHVALKIIKSAVYQKTTDPDKLEDLKREWEREVRAHIAMRKIRHDNIIEFMAAVERGHERYLLFRWAEGGNLRNFWEAHPRPALSRSFVKDVVDQIYGLADALDVLHSGRYGGDSYRHGDLKPENILCVTRTASGPSEVHVPILKIADMGLAKHHKVATSLRPATSMRYTTTRYEPPEVVFKLNLGRSRRYDMWSLGCVILEKIIWLLFGHDSLQEFNSKIVDQDGDPSHWFEKNTGDTGPRVAVHFHVRDTIRALETDQEYSGDTAVRDLLDIVKTKLLVVDIGDATAIGGDMSNPKSKVGSRVYSQELMESLRELVRKGANNESYWYSGRSRDRLPKLIVTSDGRQGKQPSLLSPESALPPQQRTGIPIHVRDADNVEIDHEAEISLPVPVPKESRFQLKTRRLDKTEFTVDNNFASQLVSRLDTAEIFPATEQALRLCAKCQQIDLCQRMFSLEETLAELDMSRSICDFCKMRWEVCHQLDRNKVTKVVFQRQESMITLNESSLPVLSLCRGLETNAPEAKVIQIGLPRLPPIASNSHYSILRKWLRECDENHKSCVTKPISQIRSPTRLIDVGTTTAPHARLFDTKPDVMLDYVALSHPWGAEPHFCTYRTNINQHRQEIPVTSSDFPDNFRHAIQTTRELGLRYLWIDSICIIQGPDGDFDVEAKRMEHVFSSAYCVIAASSARGQRDGFLNPRKERQFLQLPGQGGGDGLYVCRFIDNFKEHVLESPLSKRGWVLQERALARRTIYFTDWQAYWECGHGVRCETMTKVHNKLASFLGDANFPSKLSGNRKNPTDRGEKIRFYEDLYGQYSRLQFTHITDRSIAIAGLEQRMARDLGAQGRFGIFHDGQSLLPRSLLWRRGKEEAALLRILPGSGREGSYNPHVPSWSWMAYGGGIDFFDLPLGGVDWRVQEIQDPWGEGNGLSVLARRFKGMPASSAGQQDFEIVLDAGGEGDGMLEGWKDWRCVVVGSKRARKGQTATMPSDERTHYFLVITPRKKDLDGDEAVYERMGVGKMAGKFIGGNEVSRVTVY
ncbi:HET-domain-containing protein [Podospora aff. communis PSN243]|uniref:HET-domain-containing protein n=1 Tax=Podospora aff. communis PSN243 TaxID=3040156 RepID=A0AAV9G1M4_9PEZI|nr:HET-domain-containing protein [Podospora aff. communis PSN243]